MTITEYLVHRDVVGAIQGALADSLAGVATLATVRESTDVGWDGVNKNQENPMPNIILGVSARTDPDDKDSGQLMCSVDIEVNTDLTEDAKAVLHFELRKTVVCWLQDGTARDAAGFSDMMSLDIQHAVDSDGIMSTTISFTGVY